MYVIRVVCTGVAAAGANLIWYTGFLPVLGDPAVPVTISTVLTLLISGLILALPLDRFIQ